MHKKIDIVKWILVLLTAIFVIIQAIYSYALQKPTPAIYILLCDVFALLLLLSIFVQITNRRRK